MEDFIPWVPPISLRSLDEEEEEEEEEDMSGLVYNFASRKRKRDAILEQAANVIPKVAGGLNQPCPDGGSEVQAIVISGSHETSLNDQPTMGNVTLEESRAPQPF